MVERENRYSVHFGLLLIQEDAAGTYPQGLCHLQRQFDPLATTTASPSVSPVWLDTASISGEKAVYWDGRLSVPEKFNGLVEHDKCGV